MSEASDLEAILRAALHRALGCELLRLEPIAGQLGTRRFARVWPRGGPAETLVARVEAPEDPARRPAGVAPEPPLEPIRALLERVGLPVPARYGSDAAAGVEWLEDVGSTSLQVAAAGATGTERESLYAEACDLLPRLQEVGPAPGVAAFERRLDADQLRYKAERFLAFGPVETPAATRVVREAFDRVARECAGAPMRLSHRDFQSANLFVRAGRPPGRRLVMIDLQGAWLAPPEYDLVCLLRDSYVELEEAEVTRHQERLRPRLPDAPDAQSFARRFDLLTLSRKAKDYALFRYAAEERGDRRYLRHLPATARTLRAAAARLAASDPAFADLHELLCELPETPCAP